jgi:hypothetical protein
MSARVALRAARTRLREPAHMARRSRVSHAVTRRRPAAKHNQLLEGN